MKKTTYLYVLKEILPIFFLGMMVFTIVLLMDKILKLIELIVTRGVSLIDIVMLLLFISPSFAIFTIPTSVLLRTLVSFGRLSGDSEITAFKASGLSLYQLFLPVGIFSICAYLLTTFCVLYGLPWGNQGFRTTLYKIAQSKAVIKEIELKTRKYFAQGGRRVLGVKGILNQDPHRRPKKIKKSKAPLYHCSDPEKWRKYRDDFRWFVQLYQVASRKLRAGDLTAEFPPNCFPPRLAFVEPAPPE